MKEVRILALDDGIHLPCYCIENGVWIGYDIVDFLKLPHIVNYLIKKSYRCDIPEDEKEIFDYLTSGNYSVRNVDKDFIKKFNLIWNYAW